MKMKRKLTSKNFWRAALVRALKTFIQALISSTAVTTITATDLLYSVFVASGAFFASLANSIAVALPEVSIDEIAEVSPVIEDEEIIDTTEEDSKLYGGGIDEADE